VILDDDGLDEAEGASGNVDTRRIKGDTSLYNAFVTSELALAPIESINISSL
jgi:hypothetical protein